MSAGDQNEAREKKTPKKKNLEYAEEGEATAALERVEECEKRRESIGGAHSMAQFGYTHAGERHRSV